MSCCGLVWVGVDRAHCCRRTGGCGRVFDDAALWDAHRKGGVCLDPATLGLVQTRNGIWLRAVDYLPGGARPEKLAPPRGRKRPARRAGVRRAG
ncbi:FDXHR family putative zinc-binding protein [Pseudonocardia asaccharolytica]